MDVSHETISKVADSIGEEVQAWQRRPPESLYSVIYLDAIMVKVKDGSHVVNKGLFADEGVEGVSASLVG